jgi:hypothetical protein
VKAAAPTKNTNRATNTQAIPLERRRFLLPETGTPAATTVGCAPSKRTVSVYSATPSPSLKPQFRQKRSSDGIAEWQFEQVVSVGAELIGVLFSVF